MEIEEKMTLTLTATEARAQFGHLLRRVAEKRETFLIKRWGKTEVVVLPLSEYERLVRLSDRRPDWRESVEKVWETIRPNLVDRTFPGAADTIRKGREKRDAQLLEQR